MFDLIYAKMSYLSSKQNIIASNVANANTNSYVAKDLKPFNMKEFISNDRRKVSVAKTNDKHMSSGTSASFERYTPRITEMKLNGNDVDIDHETINMDYNVIEYRKVTDVYSKFKSMLAMSLGKQ